MAGEKQEAVNLVCSYKMPCESTERAKSWYLEGKQSKKKKKVYVLLFVFFDG